MSKRLVLTASIAALALGLSTPALAAKPSGGGGPTKTTHSAVLSSHGTQITFADGALRDNNGAQVDLIDYSGVGYYDRLLADPAGSGRIRVGDEPCSASRMSFFGEPSNWANLTGVQQGRATLVCTFEGQEYRYSWGQSDQTAPNCLGFQRTGGDATTTTYRFVSGDGCVAYVAAWSKSGKAGPSRSTTITLDMTATVQGVVRLE